MMLGTRRRYSVIGWRIASWPELDLGNWSSVNGSTVPELAQLQAEEFGASEVDMVARARGMAQYVCTQETNSVEEFHY